MKYKIDFIEHSIIGINLEEKMFEFELNRKFGRYLEFETRDAIHRY